MTGPGDPPDRGLAVLAAMGAVLADAMPAADTGRAELESAFGTAIGQVLQLLGGLPGVASVRLTDPGSPADPDAPWTVRLPLRVPGRELLVRGDPGPDGRVVLAAAALQIGAAMRAGRILDSAVEAARQTGRGSEADRRRLAGLIANLPQGVLVEDDVRRVVLVNRAFLDLFDSRAEPADMVGHDMNELLGSTAPRFLDPDEFVRVVRARMADRVPVLADELITVDGQVLERDFVPLGGNGEDIGHLWIFRDVTKRKREEERLADEYHRLVGVTAAKNRFVASVSHELRTPLTSIVSFVGLLVDPASGPLTAEQREFLEIVERNGTRLIRLVGDLLMLSRLESGAVPLEMEETDPAEVLLAAVRGQRLTADHRRIELEVRTVPGEPVIGDADRLGQVVDNLLSNAIKFTPAGGRVSATAVPDPEGWSLEISDTGIGIPAAEQGQLFSEFYRASNSRSSVTPGTGLGLAISKLIVDRHGGDLRIMSEQDRGTTAVLRLPAPGRRRTGW